MYYPYFLIPQLFPEEGPEAKRSTRPMTVQQWKLGVCICEALSEVRKVLVIECKEGEGGQFWSGSAMDYNPIPTLPEDSYFLSLIASYLQDKTTIVSQCCKDDT